MMLATIGGSLEEVDGWGQDNLSVCRLQSRLCDGDLIGGEPCDEGQ